MTSTGSGRTALACILEEQALFPRIRDADLSAAAVRLVRKQITAAGLTREDLLALRAALGREIFDRTLESLTPHQIKQLARRLDSDAPEIEVNTGSSALSHVRHLLDSASEGTPAPEEKPEDTTPKKNKYLGRKSFRTGR